MTLPALVLRHVRKWAVDWGQPALAESVEIVLSERLHATLARCQPSENRIVLRADLAEGGRRRLEEVLCHELAHVAVHRIHGPGARPHGPEWAALVRLAGFEPSIRTRDTSKPKSTAPKAPARWIYEHRCPVCQSMRIGRRPVTTWRCADCLDAGLDGQLVITRFEADHGRAA